jgi:hypothetical protein
MTTYQQTRLTLLPFAVGVSGLALLVITAITHAQTAVTGLDFPGSAAVSSTMRFKFTNPQNSGLPIYGPGGAGVDFA